MGADISSETAFYDWRSDQLRANICAFDALYRGSQECKHRWYLGETKSSFLEVSDLRHCFLPEVTAWFPLSSSMNWTLREVLCCHWPARWGFGENWSDFGGLAGLLYVCIPKEQRGENRTPGSAVRCEWGWNGENMTLGGLGVLATSPARWYLWRKWGQERCPWAQPGARPPRAAGHALARGPWWSGVCGVNPVHREAFSFCGSPGGWVGSWLHCFPWICPKWLWRGWHLVLSLLTSHCICQTIQGIFGSGPACVRSPGSPIMQSFKKTPVMYNPKVSQCNFITSLCCLTAGAGKEREWKSPAEGSTEWPASVRWSVLHRSPRKALGEQPPAWGWYGRECPCWWGVWCSRSKMLSAK